MDAHRPWVCALADVLCVKERRSIGLDGCVQWCGRVLQVRDAGPLRSAEVWERFDGTLTLCADGRRLGWEELDEQAQREKREAKKRAMKKPIVNNKRVKPNAKQQIRRV